MNVLVEQLEKRDTHRLWKVTVCEGAKRFTVLAYSNCSARKAKQVSEILDSMTDEFENFIDMNNLTDDIRNKAVAFNSTLTKAWDSGDFSEIPDWNYYMFHYSGEE